MEVIMAKNLTKAEKRKMRENTNEFVDIAHISKHYFKELKNWINDMMDPRHQSYITYTQPDLIFQLLLKNLCSVESMNQMEEKLHDMEIRMNEKLINMQRKFEDRLNEKYEELHEVIVHGFRSIHCNLWTVAETDVRDTRKMVETIHENYSHIADVFMENLRLKEQILKLQPPTSPMDTARDSDNA